MNQIATSENKSTGLAKSLEIRGLSLREFRVLRTMIWPNAQSDESVLLAIDYCRARNLDAFKRQVHIVAVWNREAKCMVDTLWPGIAELRTTASRTGSYAGRDNPIYGPWVTQTLGSAIDFRFREWAQVTVYRIVQGQRVAFTGDRVYFLETYAPKRNDDPTPNAMWLKRPIGQLTKCADANVLRIAFPEEIGGEYAAEEMEGQTIRSVRADTSERMSAKSRTEQLKQALIGSDSNDSKSSQSELIAECEKAISNITDNDTADTAADLIGSVDDPAERKRLLAALGERMKAEATE